ncbi:hypothetical protein ACFLUR_00630 [Chloroflexota bacterium]
MDRLISTRNESARCVLFALLFALLLFLPTCQRDSTEHILREQASSHRFSLVAWHVKNLPSKLVSSPVNLQAMPPLQERKAILGSFFELQKEMERLEREMAPGTALYGSTSEMETLKSRSDEISLKYDPLAQRVESIIEQDIRQVLTSEGIDFRFMGWNFIFPPVLFIFQDAPNLLVVSPRDHIDRLADLLLSPHMTISEFEMIENRLSCYDNLSAIVLKLGGMASYPAIVDYDSGFYRSIFLAAHEWTHQYLFFHPLGRAYFNEGISREMNEAVADMVGYELADRIYRQYGYKPPPHHPLPSDTGFNFTAEMSQTRLVTDCLLKDGKIDEAEQYMAERQRLFVQEGYYIRKLNQSYFAFHGTYAFDPASVSPVDEQMEELRDHFVTLGEFVLAVRDLRTHEQLLALLDEKNSGQLD